MNIKHFFAPILLTLSLCLPAQAQGGQSFKTPQEAVSAMATAAASKDAAKFVKVFGPQMKDLLDEDPLQQAESFRILAMLVKEKWSLAPTQDKSQVIRLGMEGWPFPIPLIKTKTGWQFDLEQGTEELLNRRVGRNELLTIETLQRMVEAQGEYMKKDHDGDGVLEYASKIQSSPGKHDGIHWDAKKGEAVSPLQKALRDSYKFAVDRVKGSPWFGYHYRSLLAQGPAAQGGALSYVVDGHQTKGFAMVAYPANYGKSGVKTFLVNQDGKVFEKDLGPKTIQQVFSIESFDPGEGWDEVAPTP